jgi:SM-20-related protein
VTNGAGDRRFDVLASALERDGWALVDPFLAADEWSALAASCRARRDAGQLQAAAVGRATGRRMVPVIREDRTRWLDEAVDGAPEREFMALLHALRGALNRRLFLGLGSAEAHFACYAPGKHYGVHRDRFRDDDARVVSLVCYLNDGWTDADGGALRLYLDPARFEDILPLGGRMVAFLSADFDHEVLPAARERLSIAAWLRRSSQPMQERPY